eukprot:Rmarinus@m.9858
MSHSPVCISLEEVPLLQPRNSGDKNNPIEIVHAESTDAPSNWGVATTNAAFNMANAITGAGMLALPYAIAQSGLPLGIVALVVIAAATDWTLRDLVSLALRCNAHTYERLAEIAFGEVGYLILTISQFVYAWGASIAYLIVMADSLPPALYRWTGVEVLHSREFVLVLMGVVVVLPLSMLKNLHSIARASVISMAAVVFVVVAVVYRYTTMHGVAPEETDYEKYLSVHASFFPCVGVFTFSYLCQHQSILVARSLPFVTPNQWGIVSSSAIYTSTICYLAMGVAAYFTFLHDIKPDLFESYEESDDLINACRVLFAASLILSYPLQLVVARHSVESMYFRYRTPKRVRSVSDEFEGMKDISGTPPMTTTIFEHITMTVLLWASTLLISWCVTNLSEMLDISGGLSGAVVGFIMPAAIHFRLASPRFFPFNSDNVTAVLVMILGIVTLVSSLSAAIYNIVMEFR